MSDDVTYHENRYDRLRECAEQFVAGTDFGDGFINAEIYMAFVQHLTECRVLDGLSEHDANTVSMLTLLDVGRGMRHMIWRMTDWLSDNRTVERGDDDEIAVVSVLARVLSLWTAAFAGEDFEIAQQHFSREDVELQIVRNDLPPVPDYPTAAGGEISEIEVYASVKLGEFVAEVVRFVYWDHRDGKPLETTFEVQVSGLPCGAGVADFVTPDPALLAQLAAVSTKAAEILREAQASLAEDTE